MSTWSNTPMEIHFRAIDGFSIRFDESRAGNEEALVLGPWPEGPLAFEPSARLQIDPGSGDGFLDEYQELVADQSVPQRRLCN